MKLAAMNAKMGSLEDLGKSGYIFEPKLDGIRALCYVGKGLKLISRNNIDLTDTYPELQFRKKINAKTAILDGEIIAYDNKGRPSFSLLQEGGAVTYVVFDILTKNGTSLINKPLLERKKILDKTIREGNGLEKIFFVSDGKKLWKKIIKAHLEGVIAKTAQGLYYPGERTREWLKIKPAKSVDCVIIGYRPGKRIIGSLALGLYDNKGILTYIGNVGTGFTQELLQDLHDRFKPLKSTPIINKEERAPNDVIWVKPTLVAEIKYLKVTSYGILRMPVFLRLRKDKKPKECTFKDQLPIKHTR